MQRTFSECVEEAGWRAAAHTVCLARLCAALGEQVPEFHVLDAAFDALSFTRGQLRLALEGLAGACEQAADLRDAALALAEVAVAMLDAADALKAGEPGSLACLRALAGDYRRLWRMVAQQLAQFGLSVA